MAGTIVNNPVVQFFDNNGNPLAGGKITTYLSNTTTPASTWQNEALSVLNTNPIVLNSRGEATIWLTPDIQYTFVLTDADDNLIQTVNDIYGAFQAGSNSIDAAQVSYTPAGTGAVATTQEEYNQRKVWLQDFMTDAQKMNFYLRLGTIDISDSLQAAVDEAAGAPVFSTQGVGLLSAPVVYDTTGLGDVPALKIIGAGKGKTVLKNETGGIAITATSGPSNLDFQNGIELRDFSITNPNNVLNTIGVKLVGIRGGKVAIEVIEQDSHGIYFESTVNDATDVFNVDFEQGNYSSNGGFGIYGESDLAGVHANLNFKNNRFINNALGGLALESASSCSFELNSYAYNNGPGLIITKKPTGAFSRNIKIIGAEEYDTNEGDQILIDGAVDVTIDHPYLVANSGVAQTFTDGVTVRNSLNVKMRKVIPRIATGLTGIDLFAIDTTATNVKIHDTEYSSWIDAGNTRYNIGNTTTEIIEADDLIQIGNWTPIDSSGAALSFVFASGKYVRHANGHISFTGQVVFPATADASNIAIGGLPFAANDNFVLSMFQSTATLTDIAFVPASTALIFIYQNTSTRRTNAQYSGATVYFSGNLFF